MTPEMEAGIRRQALVRERQVQAVYWGAFQVSEEQFVKDAAHPMSEHAGEPPLEGSHVMSFAGRCPLCGEKMIGYSNVRADIASLSDDPQAFVASEHGAFRVCAVEEMLTHLAKHGR